MFGSDYDLLFKVLIIGSSGVGKSNILMKFSEDMFSSEFIATIGVDFRIRKLELDNKTIKLQIWDTAGQERFHTITRGYYHGAHGVMIVYDVTNRESFDQVSYWMNQLDTFGSANVCRILVANKTDLTNQRTVTEQEGRHMAAQYGIPFIETSAKDNINIDFVFQEMLKYMKKRWDANGMQQPAPIAPIPKAKTVGNGCC